MNNKIPFLNNQLSVEIFSHQIQLQQIDQQKYLHHFLLRYCFLLEQKEKVTELMNRIDPEKNFQITLFQPTTTTTYLRAIDAMVTGDRQADIILIPRQEKERIHKWSTQIDRSATPPPVGQFHPQVGKLITDSKSMFIPVT